MNRGVLPKTTSMRRALVALVLACAAALATTAPAAAVTRPAVLVADPTSHSIVFVDPATGAQGVLASGGSVAGPSGVAITPGGAVYVADQSTAGTGAILRVDPASGAQSTVAAGAPLSHPTGLALTPAGDLLVAQPDGGTKGKGVLVRVDPLTGLAIAVSADGSFIDPIDVAVGADGTVYVLDRKIDPWDAGKSAAGGVFRVDPLTGAQTKLTGPNIFFKPTAIAVGGDGAILVADKRTDDVHGIVRRVDPATGAASELTSAGLLASPAGLAINGSSVLVSDSQAFGGPGGVVRVNLADGVQSQVTAAGVFADPDGLAFGMLPVPPAGLTVQPPTLGQTVGIAPVAGIVRYAPPSKRRLHFRRLRHAIQVPVGSTFDASAGRLALTAVKKDGTTQTGQFYGGMFQVRQSAAGGGRTDLLLRGPAPRCHAAARTSAHRRNKRRLWGDAHGSFRTRGRNSSATVRGTRWLVEDRCTGTLTRVARGLVAVRDDVRHRTVMVPKGHSYLAKNHR
jgi:DNA-binding beta-propeller fold protein YncE